MISLLQSALILILEFFHGFTHSYELSLILLSICVSIALVPLYHLTGILEKKERVIRQRLAMYKPKSHKNLKKLYEQFGYYPFYSIRSLASLFVQIPILIAAYEALSDYAPLKNTWLGFPDAFVAGLNVLPFVMTFINLGSVFISSEPESKERKQGIFIAIVFFILLYTSPAALLIYWTFNQLFSFIRYLIIYPFPKIKEFYVGVNFNFIYQFLSAVVIYLILTIWAGDGLSKTLYGIFAAFIVLIIYKFISRSKIYFRIPNLETIILNIGVMVFPAILIFKSNEVYFNRTDLIVYIFALLFISIAVSFLFSSKFSVSLILSIMFLPLVRDITHYSSGSRISFLVLFVIILIFISSIIKQKRIITVFSIIASFYLLFFVDSIATTAKSDVKQYRERINISEDLASLKLNDSASIYVFMHDGFPHGDYAQYLNLPGYKNLEDIFEQNDFKIYNVYSMADHTVATMSSLFDMKIDFLPKINNTTTAMFAKSTGVSGFSDGSASNYFLRNNISGNNITNILLQNNGYSTGNYNPYDQYMFNEDNFYNFTVYDKMDTTAEIQHRIKIKNKVLKDVLSGTLNSDVARAASEQYLINLAEFVRDNSEKNKIFVWGVGCPGHSTKGGLGTVEKEMQRFIPIYNKCLDVMKEEIETMVKSNHNAVIIFMSDHGGYFIDDGYVFPKDYDFKRTDYMKFRDIFGAFMAIRWPNEEKAKKYDNDFNVTQDLFSIVFAYLFDSEIPLKYKIKNTELRLGPHKFDKGVFYPYFYQSETKEGLK